MANHKSAEKRIRRNGARAEINGARRSRIRTFIKKVERALTLGDAAEAEQALRAAQPELQRGAAKGIVTPRMAARKISRLSARIKALKNPA